MIIGGKITELFGMADDFAVFLTLCCRNLISRYDFKVFSRMLTIYYLVRGHMSSDPFEAAFIGDTIINRIAERLLILHEYD